MDSLVFAAGFCIITLASRQIGATFKQAGFPLISGFLFTGIIAGPHVLNLIPSQAVSTLTFVDQVSLGLIAFAAGGYRVAGPLCPGTGGGVPVDGVSPGPGCGRRDGPQP